MYVRYIAESVPSFILFVIYFVKYLIFINLIINAVMGIVSRAVPQMNVIAVSFAVNIGLGLLVFVVGSDEFFATCFRIYTDRLGDWFQFIS